MNIPENIKSLPRQEFPSAAAYRNIKMITAIFDCFAQERKDEIPWHSVPERRRRLQIAIEETACLLSHLQNAASMWDQADTTKAKINAAVGSIVGEINDQIAAIKRESVA